jgi:hypothetical protein
VQISYFVSMFLPAGEVGSDLIVDHDRNRYRES